MSALDSTKPTGCKLFHIGKGDTPANTAQFFYSSAIPIDDLLSVLPVPGSFEANFAKDSLHLFSDRDSQALKKAWDAYFDEANVKAGEDLNEKDAGLPSPSPERHEVDVAVGFSKLHLVRFPALQMVPIYWSPIHDIAAVTRGTWFYQDSMLPVEPDIANRLELGYITNRSWEQAWSEKLTRAIGDGVGGFQGVLYKLWPREDVGESSLEPSCHVESCLHGQCFAAGSVTTEQGVINTNMVAVIKSYEGSVVCYKDSKTAFIFKAGFQQFYPYTMQSLSRITAGGSVGVPVIRGFDRKAWDLLHPTKAAPKSDVEANTSIQQDSILLTQTVEPDITDLVFVVHGIGQKLAEREKGFHFTHAINSLRCSINTDLANPLVQKSFRPNLGGIAVLPINWRVGFTFEEGTSIIAGDDMKTDTQPSGSRRFVLNDITPDTIPAVRSLISDVLLDIPFYMSSHKERMLGAVVKEANRVYRLWCRNNPGFQKNGRVHIIGHSLGSALMLDILSHQPTFVVPFDAKGEIGTKHFEFDTRNLFFVGSPVGFFLLLGGGKLMPRRGRAKAEIVLDEEKGKEVTGAVGTYGCMAVDNVYNVMHPNDPVAYRQNATIDTFHVTTLKKAEVPSAVATPWLVDTISAAARNIFNLAAAASEPIASALSSEEQKTPEFSDAEKKFYLLNDNGQVDYFLKPGDGPDIQYLNMLWAHTSYWTNADFVRMLVTEIGREPGVRGTLENMKAVKLSLIPEQASS